MKLDFENVDRTPLVVLGCGVTTTGLHFKRRLGLIHLMPAGTAAVEWFPVDAPLGIATNQQQSERSSA